MLSTLQYDAEVLFLTGSQVGFIRNQVGKSQDGIKRCTQFMAHIRQEGALGLVGSIGRLASLPRLLKQTRILKCHRSLVGKSRCQVSIMLCEVVQFPAVTGKYPQNTILIDDWHGHQGLDDIMGWFAESFKFRLHIR